MSRALSGLEATGVIQQRKHESATTLLAARIEQNMMSLTCYDPAERPVFAKMGSRIRGEIMHAHAIAARGINREGGIANTAPRQPSHDFTSARCGCHLE